MSAIYTYGQWIDIVDRGTSGDQVMDILASWKVNAYKLLEDNHKLESRIAELEAENDQLTAHSDIERQDDKWIPVSERLPEANKCVLIYDAGGNMTVDILVKSGGVETYFWLPKYRILFWMPLPESPKERE